MRNKTDERDIKGVISDIVVRELLRIKWGFLSITNSVTMVLDSAGRKEIGTAQTAPVVNAYVSFLFFLFSPLKKLEKLTICLTSVTNQPVDAKRLRFAFMILLPKARTYLCTRVRSRTSTHCKRAAQAHSHAHSKKNTRACTGTT